ncbi:MAG: Rnase Y domain-containing protein, partial [Treponema sp.]|nr:Rnase Y domain-containing protein [Treponema sp.]
MAWILWIILPLAGLSLGWIIRWLYARFQLTASEQRAERIKQDAIKEAEAKRKEILLEAKEKVIQERNQQEKETRERRAELQRLERRVVQKEDALDKKVAQIERTEQALDDREHVCQDRENALSKEEERYRAELERISGLSAEEAKGLIIKDMENEARHDAQALINKIEQEANLAGDKKAKEILISTIQRFASEVTGDVTVAT